MPSDLRITAAQPQDAGELLTLQRAAYVTEAQLHSDPFLPPLTETLDAVADALVSVVYLKAVLGTRIVGTVRGRRDGAVLHIGRLAVAPDQQGRGIGAALLKAVEVAGSVGGVVETCALFTGAASLDNVRLYERLGYRRTRVETPPSGPDLVHLEKPVSPRG